MRYAYCALPSLHAIKLASLPSADTKARRVSATGWGRSMQFRGGAALTGPP